MTKYFYSVLALSMVFCLTLQAKPITREAAQKRAATFMMQRKDTRKLAPVLNAQKLAPKKMRANTSLTTDPYYVFDRGENEGYVIVSGDDQTIDVLGYCENGNFDYDQLPPQLQELLGEYARQIEAIQAGAPVLKLPANHPKIEPFMSCKWSQGAPYNNLCPLDDGKRSVTGCVATAMAQILYYNREKSVTETQADIPGYSTWTKGISVSGIAAGAPIDWDNMKDTYSSSNDLQKQAVAQLMLYCGVSVKMDYTNGSSGAQIYDVVDACKNYFGYGNSVQYMNQFSSEDELDRLVYTELAAGRPVYLGGYTGNWEGHAFLTCGYENQRYYINWGWGGQSDGFYYLTNLTPGDGQGIGGSDSGYSTGRSIIIGLEPENYGEKAMSFSDANVKKLCVENWDTNNDGKLSFNEAAVVTSLGTVFQGNTTIKKFPELYYFTSLTQLPDDAFNGCKSLTTIKLPKGLKTIGNRAFKGCATLKQVDLPSGVKSIGEEAFSGCKVLGNVELPVELAAIEKETFYGCAAFTSVNLPVCVEKIGDKAFSGCTKLVDFTVNTFHPESIEIGKEIFSGVSLGKATLNILQGTYDYFCSTDPWTSFGIKNEMRERSAGEFAELEVGNTYYIYNIGTGRYLASGEAYGTQAVVGSEPMRFKINHDASMAEGVYYLSTTDFGGTKYLFRTTNDTNVGKGVQAAFVDGTEKSASTYWKIQQIGEKVYTFQIPTTGANYSENNYWGIQTDHQSGAAYPTYGVYSDVVYADHQKNCQWQLVLYDADKETLYNEAEILSNLIEMAKQKSVDCLKEEAVYNELGSTIDQIKEAERSLRDKLKLIDFADPVFRSLCLSYYDKDQDGELSFTEAASVKEFNDAFVFTSNTSLRSCDELQFFTNAMSLYGNTFRGCSNLESVVLPNNLQHIYYYAFMGCSNLTKITIPEYVLTIGAGCFQNCKALREVRVENPDPSTINLGSTVFSNVPLAQCTLYVPKGAKPLYEAAPTWKNFGKIVEVRMRTQPEYADLVTDVPGYFLNIGSRRKIAMGETYGTQSVVACSGRLYQLKRKSTMPEGVYYIYDNVTGKVVFRTDTDDKVGEGVKACFGDGTLSAKAYWKVTALGDSLYTFQVPESDTTYVEGQYMGTNESHASNTASPTNGIYWDISGVTPRTTWAFIPLTNVNAAIEADVLANELKRMLDLAAKKKVDAKDEQAVYDNLESTDDQIKAATLSLREKMHLITFADNKVLSLAVRWDVDGDEELSYEEAAAVKDISTVFKSSTITSFEELRYFTALEEIPEQAFRGASKMRSICLPKNVKVINKFAFTGCSELSYVVLLNETELIPNNVSTGIPVKATVFVKKAILSNYQSDSLWNAKVANIVEYTGIPVVSATGSRDYGKTSAIFSPVVTGAPINGTPEYVCEAVTNATAVVGDYPIQVMPGTITTPGLICNEGTFTINQAKARMTGQSYTREFGQPNPEFEVLTYQGFKNGETAEDVILVQPVFSCEATIDSPVGVYDIVVSGAEAQNYYFEYVNGKLTITAPSGMNTVKVEESQQKTILDLQGRRVRSPQRGIYIDKDCKKKILIRK